MLSYLDMAFLIILVIAIAVNAHKGFVVSMLETIRFIIIVPLSYVLLNVVEPYIPKNVFGDIPNALHTIIIFIICFALLFIVSIIILSLLKKLQHKKHMPLRHINAVLGGVFGLVKALILIFILSTVFGLLLEVIPNNNQFYQIVDSSIAVEYINAINPLNI